MRRLCLLVLSISVVATACGDDVTTTDGAAPIPDPNRAPTTTVDPSQPPPIVFRDGDGWLEQPPFTVCWNVPDDDGSSFCADGAPAVPSPVVEPRNGTVRFFFAIDDGWTFSAAFLDGDPVRVERFSGGTWDLVVPDEVAADDVIVVSGFGPEGDVHAGISLPSSDEPLVVEVVDTCAWGISVLLGYDLYRLDGSLAGVEPGARMPWEPSDFPDDWDITIWNGSPADGDDFGLRGVVAERLDPDTIEVTHATSGAFIGTFVLDPTPYDELPLCG